MGFFSFFSSPTPKNMPPLMLRNTLSGELEAFTPINGVVRMYNCGPTVYDRQHIGNLRSYIFADTLRRALHLWGYKVNQVINVTDVGHLVSDADEGEDKMEKRAQATGRSTQDIAKEITELWFADMDAIGINRQKIQFPRATEYITEQIALVKTLLQKGYAYQIADGIYFDTSKFSGYGKLGGIALGGQQPGARVEENKDKQHHHDFALWKFSPKGSHREQEWESPWGVGFPGWHLECTAMIFTLLGHQIDIHTGGIDHIPVHHNNEIAQAEAVTGKQYVRTWMHNAFITIEGKKISKSLGNTIYLSQIIDKGINPRALRYLYLTARYSQQINFTWDSIEAASQALNRMAHAYREAPAQGAVQEAFLNECYSALANDLDTPRVLALVWQNISTLNKPTLQQVNTMLGLDFTEESPLYTLTVKAELPDNVQELVRNREEARNAKDFALSDSLRTDIETAGYEVTDTREGPVTTKR